MPVDEIATLKLLSELFLSIAGQLNKLKGTPKQLFVREIIVLFDILEQAGQNILGVISSLNDFKKEKTIGMKVHYIQSAGKSLEGFCENSGRFEVGVWA
jgi:hypothetical protein